MAWNQNFGEGAKPGSEYSQQSWRDNFNGGAAAGDWTGNVNARLEAERAAFQGATWSGSSSQPSALELAQAMAGPGVGVVATGDQAAASSGAGRPSVGTGASTGVTGTGPGNAAASVPGKGPAKITEIFIGGTPYSHDKGWSDAADAEDRWGEAELLSPSWFYNWGVWGADTFSGFKDWAYKPHDPKQTRQLLEALPTAPSPQVRDFIGTVGSGFVLSGPTPDDQLPSSAGWSGVPW